MKQKSIEEIDANNSYFHFTETKNIPSIEKYGLKAQVGEASGMVDDKPRVCLSKGGKGILGIKDSFIRKFKETRICDIPEGYKKYFNITDYTSTSFMTPEVIYDGLQKKFENETYLVVDAHEGEDFLREEVHGMTSELDIKGKENHNISADKIYKLVTPEGSSSLNVIRYMYNRLLRNNPGKEDLIKSIIPEIVQMLEFIKNKDKETKTSQTITKKIMPKQKVAQFLQKNNLFMNLSFVNKFVHKQLDILPAPAETPQKTVQRGQHNDNNKTLKARKEEKRKSKYLKIIKQKNMMDSYKKAYKNNDLDTLKKVLEENKMANQFMVESYFCINDSLLEFNMQLSKDILKKEYGTEFMQNLKEIYAKNKTSQRNIYLDLFQLVQMKQPQNKEAIEKLITIFLNEKYEVGIHRTGSTLYTKKICQEGLLLTGHMSSGAFDTAPRKSTRLTLDLNVSFFDTPGIAIEQIAESCYYKNYDATQIVDTILIAIPKEDLKNNKEDIIINDGEICTDRLNPKYIIGYIRVDKGKIEQIHIRSKEKSEKQIKEDMECINTIKKEENQQQDKSIKTYER